MDFQINEYLHQQFGGRWSTQGDTHTALFALAYGNALASFLQQNGIRATTETCGNNVRVTLCKPAYSATKAFAMLPITLGQSNDPDTGKPFKTLEQLIMQQSGLASVVRGC